MSITENIHQRNKIETTPWGSRVKDQMNVMLMFKIKIEMKFHLEVESYR